MLVRTIPGCERLEATGEHAYAMTVTAGVASIKGTYAGACVLTDLVENDSLVMKLDGAGAPGTIGAIVHVRFVPDGDATTVVYDADAVVGGMIGGVGQRMLTSVSKRMAGEFFGNVDSVLAGGAGAGLAGRGGRAAPVARRRCRPGLHGSRQGIGRRLAPGVPHRCRRRCRAGRAGRRRRRDLRSSQPMTDLTVHSTARAQAAAVRRGDISARELLDLHLDPVAERNPELNAIVSLDEERAREARGSRRRGVRIAARSWAPCTACPSR